MRRKPGPHIRKRNIRTRLKLIIIVCEGTKTEPIYFERFKKRGTGLKIVIPNTSRTDPINLVNFAIKICDEYGFEIRNGDRAYCLYDVNSNTDQDLINARKLAQKHKIEVCLSNPCFELWYLLHYERYNSFIKCPQLIERLITYMPKYRKNIDVFDLIDAQRITAIKNAKHLRETHKSSGKNCHGRECNPSTQVFEIIEYIQQKSI